MRLLVVEGNMRAVRDKHVAAGGQPSGETYAATLASLAPEATFDIVRPTDGEVALPPGVALADYDGAAITGSALNIYAGGPEVTRQVDLSRELFAAGVPQFGSCWGLQVAVVAAGGVVEQNPRGREFGIGRRIAPTAEGLAHPMFVGKGLPFEAFTVHRDHVAVLPPGSRVLAENDYSLQAAELHHGRGTCWGVQYHPEFDFHEIARVAGAYIDGLIADGLFADREALEAWRADMRTLQSDPTRTDLAWRYGLGAGVLAREVRLHEMAQWLRTLVQPRAAAR